MVTPATLIEKGVLFITQSGRIPAIKILGDGRDNKAVKIPVFHFRFRQGKEEKAGGVVTVIIDKSRHQKIQVREASSGTPKVVVAKKVKVVKATKAPKEENRLKK